MNKLAAQEIVFSETITNSFAFSTEAEKDILECLYLKNSAGCFRKC